MLYCSWCDRRFIEGEMISFRLVGETEIPYHNECLDHWMANERKVAALFGEAFDETIKTFERRFSKMQFVPLKWPV